MRKIATVIGARPQFIKAATISNLTAAHKNIQEVLIHTGQHYDSQMSASFFQELSLPEPNYNLKIGNGLHGAVTGRQIEAIEKVLIKEAPNMVIVYGDTNSTLAGALAAVKLQIPVAHIEAGLRSFNRSMPEEINRVVTDHISQLLFAPTQTAVNNLEKEGIAGNEVFLSGDVMYDACLKMAGKALESSQILDALSLQPKAYYLATVHRAGNTDSADNLGQILTAFSRLAQPVVLPLHPRTKKMLNQHGLTLPKNVMAIPPQGYLNMAMLTMNAKLVLTDSGGLQKEAFFHQTPCVTLRDETEWVELVELGVNALAGTSTERIISAVTEMENVSISNLNSPYGNGDAATRILDRIAGYLG